MSRNEFEPNAATLPADPDLSPDPKEQNLLRHMERASKTAPERIFRNWNKQVRQIIFLAHSGDRDDSNMEKNIPNLEQV